MHHTCYNYDYIFRFQSTNQLSTAARFPQTLKHYYYYYTRLTALFPGLPG